MKTRRAMAEAQERLDKRHKAWSRKRRELPPRGGFVRETREALGMSAKQLSKLLKLKHGAAASLERSEAKGNIRIKTLQKVARVMQCHFFYTIVPIKKAEDILKSRAYGMIMPQVLLAVHKSGMKISDGIVNAAVYRIIDEKQMLKNPKRLWDIPKLPEAYFRKEPAYPLKFSPPKADIKTDEQIRAEALAEIPHLMAEFLALKDKNKS